MGQFNKHSLGVLSEMGLFWKLTLNTRNFTKRCIFVALPLASLDASTGEASLPRQPPPQVVLWCHDYVAQSSVYGLHYCDLCPHVDWVKHAVLEVSCVCVCVCGVWAVCVCVCVWLVSVCTLYKVSEVSVLINRLHTVLLVQLFLLHPKYHYLCDCVPVSIWQDHLK